MGKITNNLLVLIAVLTLIACTSGCPRKAPERSVRNLLLITVDGLPAERMGCYAKLNRTPSPVMDGLANAGVVLENAISPSMLSFPAHAALMSGISPQKYGLKFNAGDPLDTSVQTLAIELQARGYRTAAVIANPVLVEESGMNRGFEMYDTVLPLAKDKQGLLPAGDHQYRPVRGAVEVTKKAGDLLYSALTNAKKKEGKEQQPWFLWVNYADPMPPYRVSNPQLAGFFPDPVDASIAQVDEELGKLFRLLEMAAAKGDTLVVLAGGAPAPSFATSEDVFRVPVIITHKGILAKGKRIQQKLSSTVIAPTVMDLLGLDSSESGETGSSIAAAMSGNAIPAESPVISENLLGQAVFGKQGAIADDDIKAYQRVKEVILSRSLVVDDEIRQSLTKLCADYPESALLSGWVGITALRTNDFKSAEAAFKRADKLQPGTVDWRNNLAVTLCAKGSMPQGLDMLDKLQEEVPTDADVFSNFSDLLLYAGKKLLETKDYKSAGLCFQRLAQLNPFSFDAFNGLGALFSAQKMEKEAVAAWKSSLQLNPNQPEIRARLGMPPPNKPPNQKPKKPLKKSGAKKAKAAEPQPNGI